MRAVLIAGSIALASVANAGSAAEASTRLQTDAHGRDSLRFTGYVVTIRPSTTPVTMHHPLDESFRPLDRDAPPREPAIAVPGLGGGVASPTADARFLPPVRHRVRTAGGGRDGEDGNETGDGAARWGWLADESAARRSGSGTPSEPYTAPMGWDNRQRDFAPLSGRRGDADAYLLPPGIEDPIRFIQPDSVPFTFDAPSPGGSPGRGTPRSWAREPRDAR